MEIKVTKKQNVKVDGVKFKAQEQASCTCHGCAFDKDLTEVCDYAPCQSHTRGDGMDVIFVRKA